MDIPLNKILLLVGLSFFAGASLSAANYGYTLTETEDTTSGVIATKYVLNESTGELESVDYVLSFDTFSNTDSTSTTSVDYSWDDYTLSYAYDTAETTTQTARLAASTEGTSNTYNYYATGLSSSSAGAAFGINVSDTSAEYNFVFVNNTTTNSGSNFYGGGSLYIGYSVGTVNGLFIDNYASKGTGGAITVNNYSMTAEVGSITGLFLGNTAAGQGGAIYNRSIINSIDANFISNSGNYGGAIALTNVAASYVGSIKGSFIANSSTLNGGAIYNVSTNTGYSVDSISAEFISNEAGTNGGAIYNTAMMDSVEGVFMSNTAKTSGGAVYNSGTINFVAKTMDTVFTGNTANSASNAIYNSGTATFTASEGYSIIVNDGISGASGTMTISGAGTTVFNNTVASQTITVDTGATLALGSVTIDGTSYSADLSASTLTVNGTLSLVASNATTTITLGTTTINGTLALDLSDIYGSFTLIIDSDSALSFDSLDVILGDAIVDASLEGDVYTALISDDYYSTFEITSDGTTYTIEGTVFGAAVPEPSTYAMIIGVLALGFAYYRRRK